MYRKMRRAESLQEVVRRNEFKMSKTKKGLHPTLSNPLESLPVSKTKSTRRLPSPSSFPEIQVAQASSRKSQFGTQLSMKSSASTSSTNSNCSHYSNSPSPNSLYFSQVPPWYLHSTPYYKSQYHLNKLHKQLSYNVGGSLQSLHSINSLNQCNHPDANCTSSTSRLGNSAFTLGTSSDTECDVTTEKKKKSKKLKRVFQLMNIPKKIRQHQAEKNRFNIYTIPNETREQLKQIYVY